MREGSPGAPRAAIGIVVINYRTPELVRGCLDAAGPELAANDARLVVVDNNSGDGSADKIAAWLNGEHPWRDRMRLIRSPRNAGFSGGNNLGMAAIDADAYLLLNSDALMRPGALGALAKAMRAAPRAGIVAPRLEDEDGTAQISCFRFISPLSEFLGAAATGPVDRLFRSFAVPLEPSSEPMDCDWASFACVLLRRAALEAAGPLDDGYFMYFEDADYCRRLKREGWRVLYEPAARVVHLRGGSSPVKSAMQQKKRPPLYYYASRTRYFRKNYGPLGPYAANAAWLLGRGLAHLRGMFGRAAPPVCDRQGRDHWTNWRDPLGDSRAPE